VFQVEEPFVPANQKQLSKCSNQSIEQGLEEGCGVQLIGRNSRVKVKMTRGHQPARLSWEIQRALEGGCSEFREWSWRTCRSKKRWIFSG
jgi:hypothetical protein